MNRWIIASWRFYFDRVDAGSRDLWLFNPGTKAGMGKEVQLDPAILTMMPMA